MNGHYIVLEGIDGSGKTTTCLAVAEILSQEGYKVLLLSEPSHSEIGLFLRKQMKNISINQISLALLYAADSYDIQNSIKESYDFIISDRNYLSTVAYQMQYVDKEWLIALHQHLKKPEIVFYLNVSVEAALTRIKERNKSVDCFENVESLKVVKNNYEELVSTEQGFRVCTITTEHKSKEIVVQEVLSVIQESFFSKEE